ncbi:MAG: type II secretion system F family protein [Verrucomicrobiia bacterium]|jgi:type II secretory pathway component PulF|tara:strand:+ start:932 stop:2179 length:1248 start_codon:yes stop_codon:yes gene_type:complete
MANFNYKARNDGGEMVTGVLEAADRSAALSQISALGLFPVSVETLEGEQSGATSGAASAPRRLFQRGPTKPSLQDLANFTRQLANLLKAGMPLTGALSSMTNLESKGIPPEVSKALLSDVREGKTLSNAMALHPQSFPDMYLNMVKAGETSGSMVEVLKRLADHYERFAEVRSKVTTALVYPLFVMGLGMALIFVFMSYILPKFMQIFDGMNVSLPMSTRILQQMSGFFAAYWWLILIFGFLFSVLMKRYFASPNGKRRLHGWLLTAPMISRIARPTYFGQFARTLGALMQNGVPVLTALKITENVVQNVVLQGAIALTREGVTDGKTIAQPLASSGVFPKLMVDLVHIGEQTGDVPAALDNLADTYDNELNVSLRVVTTLIEPILIVVIALVVGFMLVGVLQAMFKITSSIGKT